MCLEFGSAKAAAIFGHLPVCRACMDTSPMASRGAPAFGQSLPCFPESRKREIEFEPR
jgi:hypothetical protein